MRFSLRSVLAVTVFAGLAFVALGRPNLFWTCFWATTTNLASLAAIVCAIFFTGSARAICVGFLVGAVAPEIAWASIRYDQIYLPNVLLRLIGEARGYDPQELAPALFNLSGPISTPSLFMRSGYEIARCIQGLSFAYLASAVYAWRVTTRTIAEQHPSKGQEDSVAI